MHLHTTHHWTRCHTILVLWPRPSGQRPQGPDWPESAPWSTWDTCCLDKPKQKRTDGCLCHTHTHYSLTTNRTCQQEVSRVWRLIMSFCNRRLLMTGVQTTLSRSGVSCSPSAEIFNISSQIINIYHAEAAAPRRNLLRILSESLQGRAAAS